MVTFRGNVATRLAKQAAGEADATFLAAAGNTNIVEELKSGKKIGENTYKVHLDGYNQLDMLTGKGPSNRNEVWYFGESQLGAVRIGDYKFRFIDQPEGWLGGKTSVSAPYLTNLRLDPFERAGWPDSGTKDGSLQYFDWFKYELPSNSRQCRREQASTWTL